MAFEKAPILFTQAKKKTKGGNHLYGLIANLRKRLKETIDAYNNLNKLHQEVLIENEKLRKAIAGFEKHGIIDTDDEEWSSTPQEMFEALHSRRRK